MLNIILFAAQLHLPSKTKHATHNVVYIISRIEIKRLIAVQYDDPNVL